MNLIKHNPQELIKKTVEKYVSFLAPTYGPAGKQIIITENEFNLKAVDDGHMASQAFEMEDELPQAIVRYIREASAKTNERVGDGTTTAALIMGSIVSQTFSDIGDEYSLTKKNTHKEAQEIKKACKEAVEQIKSQAKQISTVEELYKIAYNSYNNEQIAKLISETLFKIGPNGSLTIEDSKTSEHSVESVQGLEINKGYKSPYFITNQEKQEVNIQNPLILLVNDRIEFFKDLMPITRKIIESGRKDLVIIADAFGDDAVGGMIVNKMRGLSPLLIESPGYGDQKPELLKDISAITGGVIVDRNGVKLSEINLDQLGSCESIISKKDKTIIVGGKGNVQERISVLNLYLEAASKYDKDQIEKRIASLNGGVAVLKIGANTENEQKTIKAKAEDAVSATREAFKSGVVQGAGRILASIQTSSETLNTALKAPRNQLIENGKEFLDEEVYDPAGVLIAAIESAVSIGCGLIETGGIIAKKREDKDD